MTFTGIGKGKLPSAVPPLFLIGRGRTPIQWLQSQAIEMLSVHVLLRSYFVLGRYMA